MRLRSDLRPVYPWAGQSWRRSLCLKSRFVLWRRRRVCLTNEPGRRLSSSKSTFVLLASSSCIKNDSDELWWRTEAAASSSSYSGYSFLVSFYAARRRRKWVRMKFQTWSYGETLSTKRPLANARSRLYEPSPKKLTSRSIIVSHPLAFIRKKP